MVCKIVVDKTPQQCKFEFAPWTAHRLSQAFYQEFKVRITCDGGGSSSRCSRLWKLELQALVDE